MTALTFSHGIVSHSTVSGIPGDTQNFLVINSDKVNLHAPLDQSLVLAFTQRDAHYLVTLQNDSDIQSWGYGSVATHNQAMDNINGGGLATNEWYLYVDIDRVTGATTYGHSIYQPSEGSTPPFALDPQNRPDDQHWFDTSKNVMKVWRASGLFPAYGSFVEVVRVFVAKYIFSSTFSSMSANSPSFVGTTVGSVGSFKVGALIFDVIGNPLLRTTSNNETVFFTTEDVFTSGLPSTSSPVSGNRARYETLLVDAIGQAPAPAYSIVKFDSFNKVLPLDAATQNTSLWGMIEFPISAAGDLVQITMTGVVKNALWNWSTIGQQIFVDKNNNGLLVTVEDNGYIPLVNQLPVGVALATTAILLRRPELALTASTGGGVTSHAALLGLLVDDHTQYHTDARGDVRYLPIATTLNDLVPGSPQSDSGDVLTYSGTEWLAQPISVGVTDHTLLSNIGTNTHVQIDTHLSSTTNPHGTTIVNLTDTTITGAANGDVLVHNGTAWVDLTVGGNGEVLTANTAAAEGIEWAAPGGLANIVEDTSPQLGGDLDANSFDIQLQNGSAALPSLTFSSDTNTGMYLVSADVLGFSSGGDQKARIEAGGLVLDANDNSTTTYPININNAAGSAGASLGAYGLSNRALGGTSIDFTIDIGDELFIRTGNTQRIEINGAGDVIIDGSADALQLRGPAIDITNTIFIEFLKSDSTRTGYIGEGSTGNSDLFVNADLGELELGSDTSNVNISTGGTRRLQIESTGALNVNGTANYETLVTTDDIIPNKKYVDDAVTSGGVVPYDIGGQTFGTVPGGTGIAAEILRLNVPRPITLDSGAGTGGLSDLAQARVTATISFTLRIWTAAGTAPAGMPATSHDGSTPNPIGTITFGVGSATGVVAWTAANNFALPAGTTLVVEGVTGTDATLADIFYTILATDG